MVRIECDIDYLVPEALTIRQLSGEILRVKKYENITGSAFVDRVFLGSKDIQGLFVDSSFFINSKLFRIVSVVNATTLFPSNPFGDSSISHAPADLSCPINEKDFLITLRETGLQNGGKIYSPVFEDMAIVSREFPATICLNSSEKGVLLAVCRYYSNKLNSLRHVEYSKCFHSLLFQTAPKFIDKNIDGKISYVMQGRENVGLLYPL